MLGIIRSLLRRRDPLIELGRSGDSAAFARSFAEASLIFLSLPIPDSLDPVSMTSDQLLELTEKAAKTVSEEAEIIPFTYREGAGEVFPIFTSEKAVNAFGQKYVLEVNRVFPFGFYTVAGRTLIPYLGQGPRAILNARNDVEYPLSDADIEALRALTD